MSVQQLEQQLQATLRKMELTLEAIADAVVWVGADQQVQWCNPSFEHLVNRPNSEIIGSKFSDLLPLWQAGEAVSIEAYPDWQIHQGKYQTTEYEFHHSDRCFVLQISGTLADITNDKSAILVIKDVTQTTDINERKRTEEALKASEARLNAILSSVRASIQYNRLYADREWEYEYISSGCMWVWGFTPEELMADKHKVPSRIHPEDWQVIFQQGMDAIFAESPFQYEYRYNHPDGNLRWISVTITSIRDEAADCWITTGISTDITERKQTEEALRRSNAILKAQQEAAVDGILIIDENHKVVSYNQRFVELWQIPAAVIETGDDWQLLASVVEQLENPEEFLARVEYLYQHLEEISRDEIFLKGGRVFDRYSAPVSSSSDNYFGRIWYFRDITERKQAEEALKASEAQLNAIFDNALAVIYYIRVYPNREWEAEYCSPSSLEHWGYTSEEIIADKNLYFSRIWPEDREKFYQPALDAILAEQNFESEYRYNHPDGSLRWIFFNLTSVRDEATDSWLATIISTDITNQKRAEEALKASETRLNTILNSALAAIHYNRVYLNREWEIEYCSPRSLEIWGYTPEEMIANKDIYFSRILPEDMENVYPLVMDAILAEQDFEGEYRYSHPDSSLRWIFFNVTSVRDEAADCWRVTVVSTDITDKKLAEEALKASEARLNTILNSALAAIYYIRVYNSEEWYFEYCSSASIQIWGYTPEELMADKNLFVSRIVPEDLETIYSTAFTAVFAERSCEGEYRHIHNIDGSLRWISYSLTSVRDEAANCWIATVISIDITDKKRAELALRESEIKFRTIVENVNNVLTIVNQQGVVDYVSPNVFDLVGYTAAEIEGKSFEPFIHPDDVTKLWEAFNRVAVNGEKQSEVEYRSIHKDGSWKWGILNVSAFQNADGNSLFICATWDITDRKEMEEALIASEAKLNTMLDTTLAVISRYRNHPNRIWEIEYHSPGCQLIWGYPAEELLADNNLFVSRIVLEDLEVLVQNSFDYIFTGRTYKEEYRYLHPDGKLRWISLTLNSVRDEAADCWMTTALSIDITDRKLAEQALQRRAQAESLLSSVSRSLIDRDLSTAIHFTLEAIAKFIAAERGCIYTYSEDRQECFLLYEWNADGIPALADVTRSISLEEFQDVHQQMFQGKVVQFSSAEGISQNDTELNILTASGIKSALVVPMMHTDTVVGILVFHAVSHSKTWSQEDINFLKLVGELIAMGRARHQAEAALTLAKEAAEAANRAKSMFLANMSHELRTPLNAILGFAQLMERDRTLNPKQRESLATINRSGEHLLNLIDDVLEMSKIEAGRVVYQPETFNLLALLRVIQEMFLVRTQAKQLFLNFEIASDVPSSINTDEGKLRQVLINLLSNAVKFTVSGGITLRLKKAEGTRQEAGEAEDGRFLNSQSLSFEIEDTGCGIAPEEMKNLFRPFVQTSSGIHLKSGTGLGLTISREFIRLMGGEIRLSSTLGQGSTFSFDIQVNIPVSTQAASLLDSRRVIELAANHPSVRILVVDDIPDNCDLIAQLLSSTGFEVQVAFNGEEAIAQWQAWQPHLIFMDMRMPVMDGYEATRKIRAKERERQHHHSIPDSRTIIIALTASAFREQRATIIAAGCDDLVRKPFKEPEIFDKIAEYLEVNYIYADELNSYSELQDLVMSQQRNDSITSDDLVKMMPEDWLLQLRQAALEVDGDRILQLVGQIPPTHTDFANNLTQLVRRFCFDEILELAQTNTRSVR